MFRLDYLPKIFNLDYVKTTINYAFYSPEDGSISQQLTYKFHCYDTKCLTEIAETQSSWYIDRLAIRDYQIKLEGSILGKAYNGFFDCDVNSYLEYLQTNVPNLFDKLSYSAINGIAHGLMYGAANSIGRPSLYFLSVFTFKFVAYSQQEYEADKFKFASSQESASDTLTTAMRALCLAAYETGQIFFMKLVLDQLSNWMNGSANNIENNAHQTRTKVANQCRSWMKFGFFAPQAAELGFAPVSVVAGGIANVVTEKAASFCRMNRK